MPRFLNKGVNGKTAMLVTKKDFKVVSDVHDLKTRQKNMSAIRARGTRPEKMFLEILESCQLYPMKNKLKLMGNPDFVLKDQNIVVFVNGCFWHGHQSSCFKRPVNNAKFWSEKINRNKQRDFQVLKYYQETTSWRYLLVWECALIGPDKLSARYLKNLLVSWVSESEPYLEIEPFLLSGWED